MISCRKSILLRFLFCIILVYFCYILYKNYAFELFNRNKNADSLYLDVPKTQLQKERGVHEKDPTPLDEIVVAVVACGEKLKDTLTMLKSCLLFSSYSHLKFIIFADDNLMEDFKINLNEWQKILNGSFQYEIFKLKFPEKNANEWRKLFKPCASQRLFLPTLLPHIDSLIYLDIDTLFLSPVESLWKHFKEFNSSHIAALALEHEDPNVSWYSRFAKHPYYGKLGVNSGVMLMNLTRMRSFHWEDYVSSVYHQWRTQITWGDQDIINIIFHYHSDKLLLLSCDENYRPDQCTYGSTCPKAIKEGVSVLHGSRNVFHYMGQPAFKAIHETVQNFKLGTEAVANFLKPLIENLSAAPESNCGKLQDAFIKIPKEIFKG